MPYIGLVLTSIGFIVPGILAWRRRYRMEAMTSIAVSVSSVLYHGTLHPIAKCIDMGIAHLLGIASLGRVCVNMISWRRGWIECGLVVGTFGSIAIYWFKSRTNPHLNSRYWHMLFHVTGQTTWVSHIMTRCW